MNKFVLKYGLISGLIMVVLFILSFYLLGGDKEENFQTGEILGYISMILSLIAVFFGIKSFREKQLGGVISFGKALAAGTLITILAGLIFALYTIIFVEYLAPDFTENYYRQYTEQINSNEELSASAKAEMINDLNSQKELFSSGAVQALVMFFTVFPIGLIISLISAAVLKKNPEPAT